MQIKLFISIIIILRITLCHSQNDTIRSRIFSSVSFKKPKGDIYISEKGTNNFVIADELGLFKLIPKIQKEKYSLEISVGNYPITSYE